MKLDKTAILKQLSTVGEFIKRFRFVIAFAIFGALYAYILTQVSAINIKAPSEAQITDQVTTAPRTKVDPELAEKIKSLEEENVQVKTIFNEARKNPFDE
jgi:hypothetical protein